MCFRLFSNRGTCSQGCSQLHKKLQVSACGLGHVEGHCQISASGGHVFRFKLGLLNPIPQAVMATWTQPPDKEKPIGSCGCLFSFLCIKPVLCCLPWVHLCSGSCLKCAGNGCHTSDGAMRGGRTHIHPGNQSKTKTKQKHLAQSVTGALFSKSQRVRREGRVWDGPKCSWKKVTI